jgi:hypothetical protein
METLYEYLDRTSKLFNSMDEYIEAIDDVIFDLSKYPADNKNQITFYKKLRNKAMYLRYKSMSNKEKISLIRSL